MKKATLLAAAFALFAAAVFSSCTKPALVGEKASEESSSEIETETETAERIPAAESEIAMENFLRKLDEGNYVIEAKGYAVTNVASPEEVAFLYENEKTDDVAYLTLDGETFRAVLGEEGLRETAFVSTDDAIRAAKTLLPNDWVRLSGGNIFNLFYNNVDEPLTFTSYEKALKESLLSMGGYRSIAINKMHEVTMTFDAQDPTEVRFQAVIDDDEAARIYYDDLDIVLTFGSAESDERIGAWKADPVYPETRTGWTEDDLFNLNSVFFAGYGERALPFPSFASYALTFDEQALAERETIVLSDHRASEQDVENYKKTLLSDGFEAAEDGSLFRKTLRKEYLCSVLASVDYEDGFRLEARRFYDNPEYESLEEINEALKANRFPALPEDRSVSVWSAIDTAAERSESWLYYYEYDLSLYATMDPADEKSARDYLEAYGKTMEKAGFVRVPANVVEGDEEVPFDSFESPEGLSVLKITADAAGTYTLQFRVQKGYSKEEAAKIMRESGFPEMEFIDGASCRSLAKYHEMTRGFDGTFLFVYQPFKSPKEADEFLTAYVEKLQEAGFEETNPVNVGSNRQNAYANVELNAYVGFDFIPEEKVTNVNLEFVLN